jgi:WD40 repeat protein
MDAGSADVEAGKTLVLLVEPHRDGVRVTDGDGKVLAEARPPGPRRDTIVPDPKLPRLKGHTGEVTGVRFLSGGWRAVSVGRDGRVLLWDLVKGGPPRNIEPEKGKSFLCMAVSRDGKMLAAGTAANPATIHLYDLVKGALTNTIDVGRRYVDSLVFNASGTLLAVGSKGEKGPVPVFFLYRVANGKRLEENQLLGAGRTVVTHLAFVRGEKQILAGIADVDGEGKPAGKGLGCVMLWDLGTKREVRRIPRPGHRGPHLAVLPDGEHVAVGQGAGGGEIEVWPLVGKEALHWPAAADSLHPLPGGQWLLTTDATRRAIQIWDAATGKALHEAVADTSVVRHADVSPDGARLLTGQGTKEDGDYDLHLWSLPDPEALEGAAPRRDAIVPDPKTSRLKGHTGEVTGVRFLSGSTRAVSVGLDGRVMLWDLEKGAGQEIHPEKGRRLTSLAVSPDGRKLAAGTQQTGELILYDLEKQGPLQRILVEAKYGVNAVEWSADGKRVFAAYRSYRSGYGRMGVFDAASGKRLSTHRFSDRESVAISDFALAHGGKYLLAALWDYDADGKAPRGREGVVVVWDVEKRAEVRRFNTPPVGYTRLAVFPDGKQVAAGQAEQGGEIQVWPLDGQGPLRRWRGSALSLAVLHGGRWVLTTSNRQKSIRIWDVAADRLLYEAPWAGGDGRGAVSPDGTRLITYGGSRGSGFDLRLWSLPKPAE